MRSKDSDQAFVRSLHDYGFAALTDHPLDMTRVHQIYDDWQAFFDTKAKFQFQFNGSLIASGANDMYMALGKDDQKIYVIPSKKMVVGRRRIRPLTGLGQAHHGRWFDQCPAGAASLCGNGPNHGRIVI